ncbi:XRE family transcriptional regulator [Lawsonibacter asaccharolyticus]
MAKLSEFGKDISKRLIDLSKPQTWLIEEVRNKTGLYFDDSYMYKIKTGQLSTPKIVQAICEILDIQDCNQDTSAEAQ